MEIKKITETKSALPRTEYVYHVKFDQSTPSRQELKEKVAKDTKSTTELTVVKKIENHYGEKEAKVTVFVYQNEEALQQIEFKHVLAKHNPPKAEGEQ